MQLESAVVTGGAGFIGSRLSNYLANNGIEVTAIDDEFLGTPDNLNENVTYINTSILDDNLPFDDVDAVFNLAALSSYGLNEDDPQEGARVNVEGLVNIFEQARQANVGAVVYASTSSIYGSHYDPAYEGDTLRSKSAYEASKRSNEAYAEYYRNHHDLNVAGMRPFSVYQGYKAGEGHKGDFANIISKFTRDIANGDSPEIYGDGTQTRDFVHVLDVAKAFTLAAENQINGEFNIGTGTPLTFNEVVEIINATLDTDIKPTYIENPIPEDIYVAGQNANYSKLHDATGWEPEYNPIDGIEEVCKQYKK